MKLSKLKSVKLFTMTEMLVVMVIVMLLAALLLPALHRARQKGEQVTCLNNLRNLGLAIQLFRIEYQVWPRGPLDEQLGSSMDGRKDVFRCPSSGEYYDTGFVSRETDENDGYVLGCPYHHLAGFTLGQGTQLVTPGKILHNGVVLNEGVEVTGGTLVFDDGSKVNLTGKAAVVASFRAGKGPLYTVIRIFQNDVSSVVDADVTPGSRFEVVTPAAIAGVAGTRFKVTANYNINTGDCSTAVAVTSGKVLVTGRKGATGWEPKLVSANGQVSLLAKSQHVQHNPKKK